MTSEERAAGEAVFESKLCREPTTLDRYDLDTDLGMRAEHGDPYVLRDEKGDPWLQWSGDDWIVKMASDFDVGA